MSKIRVLPDSLANKIAAGEVVERPASIVKELIENSIDAGARRIEVAVESGGRRLIRVGDDGEGMSRDDAILAFERHATSKIKTAEDLEAIMTLGFRGEALASIASVAKVRLRTQREGEVAGTEVEISGGRLLNVRDIAFSRGAEFEIRDLFFNVPARRKFLKTEATESYHVANLMTHYALASPQLSFTLTNNNRESLRVAPAADLRERAYQIFGGEFIGDLIEVLAESGEMRARGFVSSPSATRTNRDSQYFFINGRYVRDKIIGKALSEAYRAMIPAGVYPSAMLFVELPPHEVDVNVHPAKTEVRFMRGTIVHDLIRDAVRAAIGSAKAGATSFVEKKIEPAVSAPAAILQADDPFRAKSCARLLDCSSSHRPGHSLNNKRSTSASARSLSRSALAPRAASSLRPAFRRRRPRSLTILPAPSRRDTAIASAAWGRAASTRQDRSSNPRRTSLSSPTRSTRSANCTTASSSRRTARGCC
jgi:DNA mismatch repair protein MutL